MNKHEKEDEKPRGVSVGKAPSVGPDPVVAAQDKAVKEALKDTEPTRDQAQVQEDLDKEIEESEKDA